MLQILFIVYVVGLICGLILLWIASRAEPTIRDRAFLWTYGLAAVMLWPWSIIWMIAAGATRALARRNLGR